MSKATFKRPAHLQVHAILSGLDDAFLARAGCYFGGGTRIVLEPGAVYTNLIVAVLAKHSPIEARGV